MQKLGISVVTRGLKRDIPGDPGNSTMTGPRATCTIGGVSTSNALYLCSCWSYKENVKQKDVRC